MRSASSFSSVPTWAFSQTSLTLLFVYILYSSWTRSRFLIGPDFFFQPFFSQVGAHLSRTLIQNSESVWISTGSSAANLMAFRMAVPSMRILVVSSSLPDRTGCLVAASITAQPPGPGLGSALPSVQNIFIILL